MNCYFDGSVDGRSDEWLGIGGFVATDETWTKFQDNWNLMLRSREPAAPYLHMSDLLTGNELFRREDGWTEQNIRGLVWDAAQVLASLDQTKVCGVACAVDVNAYKRLIAEGYRVTKPAVICAENGVGHLLKWYTTKHRIEPVRLFFDQGEPFIKSIRTRWLREEEKKTRIKHPFWGLIADVQPLNMRDAPGIQAADLLAWAFVRRLRGDIGDEWSTLATRLSGGRALGPGALTATQLDPITEEVMRSKYPRTEN